MKPKEEAPGRLEPSQGQNDLSTCVCGGKFTKCICKNLSKREKKVLELLISGKHSVTDITIKTGYSDPRHYFRALKKKGIPIKGEWVNPSKGVKYKLHWLGQITPEPQHANIENIHTVGEIIQRDFKNLFERNHYDQ